MALANDYCLQRKTYRYGFVSAILTVCILATAIQKVSGENYVIDTNLFTISEENGKLISNGTQQSKSFTGPNGGVWNHTVAKFIISEDNKKIFNKGNNILIKGNYSLSINATGNFTISTSLDVSGQSVEGLENSIFVVGGFVRTSNSCCVLGAGPGAAFSYHGAGHGGRGGGFYQDRNTSRLYSWEYNDIEYSLGGSTSTVMFESKAGSGGGAIEVTAHNGTLTIDAPIRANGYTSPNTTNEIHCAGGSAGGLIRLHGEDVHFTSSGMLSARGGNSGFSHKNKNTRCGDGGGGGVIQVFAQRDIKEYRNYKSKNVNVDGGHGLDKGEDGSVFVGFLFKQGVLDINTTSCTMKWFGILLHQGLLSDKNYVTPRSKMIVSYKVCTFEFVSSVYIGRQANLNIKGKYSLKIVSKNGDLHIMTDIDLRGDQLGGFHISPQQGIDQGPGNVTGCNATELYGDDFTALIGGSVCKKEEDVSSVKATGGGAIEIRAKNGDVFIGKSIIADGASNDMKAGSMGGTVRLVAGKRVHLNKNARLSAKSSSTGKNLACGGIIQIDSTYDIQGLCETKFDVTGGCNGLTHVMVKAHNSYQVQFIQDGSLLINTGTCRWSHRPNSNHSMAYTQEGKVKQGVCLLEFRTPIVVNGSVIIKMSGENSLDIKSEQGMFIGSDFVVDSSRASGTTRFLGGYCTINKTQGEGQGRGYPGQSAGGGHGGLGGLFKEENGFIYGGEYGVQPFKFTGGSTGASRGNGSKSCGGGAIRMASEKNLTIDAAIKTNGFAMSFFGEVGGSSGGAIDLSGKYVIFKGRAKLEARGSNATSLNNTGGGGGGVIVIDTKATLVGQEPNATIATAGGRGSRDGKSGVVIINGNVRRQKYYPVIDPDTKKLYHGCRQDIPKPSSSFNEMLEHEARPKKCVETCELKSKVFALINGKLCYCMDHQTSFQAVEEKMCNKSCRATFRYQCGGQSENIFSVYKTGFNLPTTSRPTEPPTTRPFGEPSPEFKNLNNVNITVNNSRKVLENLYNLTTVSDMNGGDVQVAAGILTKIATSEVLEPKNINETKDYGQIVVETVSHLLGHKNSDNWPLITPSNDSEKEKPLSTNNLLETTEMIGVKLGKGLQPSEQVTVESSNIALGIECLFLESFKGATFPQYDRLGQNWQFEDKVFMPEEPINQLKKQGATETTIVFLLYNNEISQTLKRNLARNIMINTKVIALKFGHEFSEPFQNPVVLTFTKRENWKNLTNPQCSFLDFKKSSSGNWSSDGCKTTSHQDEYKFKCECNHLTNFAVLMQVKDFTPSRAHQKALQMITYIGCGISLFGLALTLATFLSLETLASERTSIHKNLVVAIGLAQIIFLAGIDAVYNPIACKIVALSLHYLYTAAFTWMCCEGIHLYTKVIEVFSSETSKMKYYYMLGWGAPLIIVIISAASRMSGYGTETACWISIDHGLIWAFVGPVLIIMSINFVVMVMVIKVIIASVTSIHTPGNTSQVKAGLKGMVVLLPLLGLTWAFGLMAVNEKTIAFQYIFAILNSLQGLFIFAFHCIGNSEVRVAYKRLHEKRTLAKMPEHSLSSGNHHKNVEEFKRRMNSRETNSTGDDDIIVTKAIRSVSDVKLSGAHDHVAMQTFGDADSGRWSLNCPSPDSPIGSTAENTPRKL